MRCFGVIAKKMLAVCETLRQCAEKKILSSRYSTKKYKYNG